MNNFKLTAIAALLPLAFLAGASRAQDATAPSLQDLLKNQYKVTATGSDAEGFKIVEPGTVLALEKGGVIAVPQDPVHVKIPHWGMCSNTFKNGILTTGKGCSMMTEGSKLLDKGAKLFVTRFEVNQKANKITFNLVECDTCNGATAPSAMKVSITFEFADKFLDAAEPGQVTDVIGEVLAPDAAATRAAASAQPAEAQPAAAAPAQAAAPPQVNIGDPPQRVIAILGNPQVILPGAGGRQIYKYKDFKVIFIGGKVAEVD